MRFSVLFGLLLTLALASTGVQSKFQANGADEEVTAICPCAHANTDGASDKGRPADDPSTIVVFGYQDEDVPTRNLVRANGLGGEDGSGDGPSGDFPVIDEYWTDDWSGDQYWDVDFSGSGSGDSTDGIQDF